MVHQVLSWALGTDMVLKMFTVMSGKLPNMYYQL